MLFAVNCYLIMLVQSKELASASPRSAGRQKKVKFAMNLNKSQGQFESFSRTKVFAISAAFAVVFVELFSAGVQR